MKAKHFIGLILAAMLYSIGAFSLIILKITGIINLNWFIVFLPVLIPFTICLLLLFILMFVFINEDKNFDEDDVDPGFYTHKNLTKK